MKPRTIRLSVAAVLTLVIVIGRDYVIPTLVYATGRVGQCTWGGALPSSKIKQHQMKLRDDFEAASRRIRVDGDFELWETPRGAWWVPAGDPSFLFFDLAEQERDIYELGSVAARPGDVVLDCGANIGVYSKKALRFGAARVVAIEPEPRNAECIRRNLKDEIAQGRVQVETRGVWDKDDVLVLHVDPQNGAAHSLIGASSDGAKQVKVPLTTIDRIVAGMGLARVDFIKMDIEGAERQAVAGASGTLKRWKPRMALSVYHLDDDPEVISALVKKARLDYVQSCGPCQLAEWRLRPEVFFFQ